MTLDSHSALVVIDAQEGIKNEIHWGGHRNNHSAERNIQVLLKLWRARKMPVVIIQHCSSSPHSPFHPGQKGTALMDFIQVLPEEKLVQKSTANAFIRTGLLEFLEDKNIRTIIITGFVTNNSVEATARYAGDYGFQTIVIADAIACFDKIVVNGKKYSADLVHQLSLANLKDEYASIMTTTDVVKISANIVYNTKS